MLHHKSTKQADPRKVARMVLERIETFPETYYQQCWYGDRTADNHVEDRSFHLYWNQEKRSAHSYITGLVNGKFAASEWSECGATGCVAGHTSAVAAELGMLEYTSGIENDSPAIKQVAANALGLTDSESGWLFEGYRTLDEVTESLHKIAAGEDI